MASTAGGRVGRDDGSGGRKDGESITIMGAPPGGVKDGESTITGGD